MSILSAGESEIFVKSLISSDFDELGTLRWLEKHERVEKLTVQAISEAISNDKEEYIKDLLITHEKLPALVHEVILIELWREIFLPELLKKIEKDVGTFTVYPILYHEATCFNLIETVIFHPDAAETLGDAVSDLADYSIRGINFLLYKNGERKCENGSEEDSDVKKIHLIDRSVVEQSEKILLKIAFKSLSSLLYIIENLERVQTGVLPRLINSSDTPMILTETLISKPWRKMTKDKEKGHIEIQWEPSHHTWLPLAPENRLAVGKIEAQAWLAIYQLFLNKRVLKEYDINDFRLRQLLRLRALLHDGLLEQLPFLGEFLRWLNEMAIASSTASNAHGKSSFILELLPPFRTALEKKAESNKKKLMDIYTKELLHPTKNILTEKAKKLSSVYDFEAFETVLPQTKCALCGNPATKKCSRCRNEWYCKRECQVKHWEKHRRVCELVEAN